MQCLVLPALAIVLLAFLYYNNWTKRILSKAEQTLVFCSALGLLLLLKFMNRVFSRLAISAQPL